MLKNSHIGRVLTLLVGSASLLVMSANARAADYDGGKTSLTSSQAYAQCIKEPDDGYFFCALVAAFVDPPMPGLTGFQLSMQYNTSLYTFDQALSGPLGVLSVGGDAPPVDAGVGTQPLQVLPSTGYSAGSPLPGSTLTYTNVGGVLTVDYQLGSSVDYSGDANIFRLSFDLIHPLSVEVGLSTVTYSANTPGADFTTLSFTCTTSDMLDQCGSAQPTQGVSFNFTVPEPPTWATLILGAGLLGLVARRRKALAA